MRRISFYSIFLCGFLALVPAAASANFIGQEVLFSVDPKFDIQKVKAYSKFANKIWNAARFVLEQTNDFDTQGNPMYDEEDKKSDEELKSLIKEITKEMDEYKFYIAAEKLYHYFWHTFADIIIERSKQKILEDKNADSARALLYTHLSTLLKLLHPFMPFITEEIWQIINKDENKILMVEPWPFANAQDFQPTANAQDKPNV